MLRSFATSRRLATLLLLGGLACDGDHDSLLLWIVGVLLVDVAHVYASLYRTYLDPVARPRSPPAG